MKLCRTCKSKKPADQFYNDKAKLDGKQSQCKGCTDEAHTRFVKTHKNHLRAYQAKWNSEHPGSRAAWSKASRKRNRGHWLVNAARGRAKKKRVAFDLDAHRNQIQARVVKGVCELTGQPFNLNLAKCWNSPSLHRIHPAKGYVYSNVQVICYAMNCAMGTWGEDQLQILMQAWLDRKA